MGVLSHFPDFRHPVKLFRSVDETTGILFAVYLAYFLAVPLFAFLLERYGVNDKVMLRLGEYGNRRFAQFKKVQNQKSRTEMILSKEDSDESDVEEEEGLGSAKLRPPQYTRGGYTATAKVTPAPVPVPVRRTSRLDKVKSNNVSFISRVFGRNDRDRYLDGFWRSIMDGVSYAAITGNHSRSSCCTLCMCCGCCAKSSFYNDFYFYLSNNHQFISMFAACPGHPFSRNHRKLAYTLQQSIAFVLATIAASFAYAEKEFTLKNIFTGKNDTYRLTSANQSLLLNMFVISPFVLLTYTSIYALLACPCLKHDCTGCCLRFFKKILERGGSFLGSILCVVVSLVLLFIISMWPTDRKELYRGLVNYTVQVQLFSLALDTVGCLLVFWPFFYVEADLCGVVRILRVGGWIGERRQSRHLQFGSKPAARYRLLHGLLTIQAAWWHAPADVITPEPPKAGVQEVEEMEEGRGGIRATTAAEQRAALSIQCCYRIYFAHRLVALLREMLAEHTAKYLKAVLVLQRHTRGLIARAQLQLGTQSAADEAVVKEGMTNTAETADKRQAFKRKHQANTHHKREKHHKAGSTAPPDELPAGEGSEVQAAAAVNPTTEETAAAENVPLLVHAVDVAQEADSSLVEDVLDQPGGFLQEDLAAAAGETAPAGQKEGEEKEVTDTKIAEDATTMGEKARIAAAETENPRPRAPEEARTAVVVREVAEANAQDDAEEGLQAEETYITATAEVGRVRVAEEARVVEEKRTAELVCVHEGPAIEHTDACPRGEGGQGVKCIV